MKVCNNCKLERDDSLFQLYKGKPSGWCRLCKTEKMKKHRIEKGINQRKFSVLVDGKKLCMSCNEILEYKLFSPSKRGLGGISSYCRKCQNERYKDKEKARNATKKYREVNRESYLANHRISQFNRKSKIRAVSDGTVDSMFLKKLYSTSKCHYCMKDIEEKDRTLDHKIPLSKGGIHSAKNCVMACFSCNSSKRALTDVEFFEVLNKCQLN